MLKQFRCPFCRNHYAYHDKAATRRRTRHSKSCVTTPGDVWAIHVSPAPTTKVLVMTVEYILGHEYLHVALEPRTALRLADLLRDAAEKVRETTDG